MNLPIDSFIGSSFISKDLCDDILAWIDTVDGSERKYKAIVTGWLNLSNS
jgi:hypothetical protein